jgi:hypothetical protein
MKMKKPAKKTLKPDEDLLTGLEEIASGLFPDSFAVAYIDGLSDGLNEHRATKHAMVAHRGD